MYFFAVACDIQSEANQKLSRMRPFVDFKTDSVCILALIMDQYRRWIEQHKTLKTDSVIHL